MNYEPIKRSKRILSKKIFIFSNIEYSKIFSQIRISAYKLQVGHGRYSIPKTPVSSRV